MDEQGVGQGMVKSTGFFGSFCKEHGVFTIKSVKQPTSVNLVTPSGIMQDQITSPRKLELLAPAKNLEIGIAAILAGADAVYIGGSGFGARAAAGNDLGDISQLCAFAHRFGARVYLTVNTLLYDKELNAVRQMIKQAVQAGVDALIVQDPAILTFPEVQNIELHASTQMNINTLDKVDYCAAMGMSQVVLPREFSVSTIKALCRARPNMRFEVFVSGAMCVSVSGECFISEYMTKRSANRGECAQICRLPMELYHVERKSDNPPQLIAQGHLLSMKDNLRLEQLERLVDAGACSLKIEGRLKDRDYVVNQVAAFRERLDLLISQNPERYARASLGIIERKFIPDVNKTFNRGFTSAYLDDDNRDLVEIRTPKSFGQKLGTVCWLSGRGSNGGKGAKGSNGGGKLASSYKAYRPSLKGTKFPSKAVEGVQDSGSSKILELTLDQATQLSNGDSFTFFTSKGELQGFRVNRVALSSNQAGLGSAAKSQGKSNSSSGASNNGQVTAQAGEKVYLYLAQDVPELTEHCTVYRNVDIAFVKQLEQPKALQRKVPLSACVEFAEAPSESVARKVQCRITFQDEYQRTGQATFMYELSPAEPLSQSVMADKLAKLGDEYLTLQHCSFKGDIAWATFPISQFNQLRREALGDYLSQVQLTRQQILERSSTAQKIGPYSALQANEAQVKTALGMAVDVDAHVQQQLELMQSLPYLDTTVGDKVYHKPAIFPRWPEAAVDSRLVLNQVARQVLESNRTAPLTEPRRVIAQAVMTCRNCLIKNHALCHKESGKTTGYYLEIGGQRFDIVTDCKRCLMYLIPHA